MRKTMSMAALAVALFASSCSNSNKDSAELADSLNQTKDTTTNAMATGGIAVDESDAKFAVDLASGGMAEVKLSELAMQKSGNADVKSFATMMVKDHGEANKKLMALAATKNITLPTDLDEDHQKLWNDLNGKSGMDFDKAYVDAMVDGHEKAVKLLQDEVKDAKDADLKMFAQEVLPTVEGHLNTIKGIKAKMK